MQLLSNTVTLYPRASPVAVSGWFDFDNSSSTKQYRLAVRMLETGNAYFETRTAHIPDEAFVVNCKCFKLYP